MDKKTNIYYLHNGDNVPFYIGKTVQNPSKRLNNHKKVFGKKTLLEIIDVVENNNWLFWEKHYISLFKSWGFNLENKNEGGGGCITHEVSESAREKISKTHKNLKKPFTESHKINHQKSYENRNVTWGNKISEGLKGRKITWEQGNVGKPSSPINQYDLEGNFIKKWDNIKDPSLIYKCYISGCLKGRQKTAGGYIWKYADK